jgi:5-formyltetrahydrofolate cyclo-ligase
MHPNNEIILIPNIILIPLVGFDESKNRIGYGGGYYDRTIEYLEKKNDVLKLGVAFDEQETIKIPNGKYDKKLDIIITQTRLIT